MDTQTVQTSKKAGYEYLLAYKLTIPIYDYTVEFCKRCTRISTPHFPSLSSARTQDQMVQAARSGSVNIAEGYAQKSLASYIKLVGVAIGSQEELLTDYLSYARQHQLNIYNKDKARDIREVREIWEIMETNSTLPSIPNFPHLPDHPESVINIMITLISQVKYLQQKLVNSLMLKHKQEGGFSENLLKQRIAFKKGY